MKHRARSGSQKTSHSPAGNQRAAVSPERCGYSLEEGISQRNVQGALCPTRRAL